MSVQMVDAARLRALVGFEDLIEPVSRAFQDFSAGLAQSAILIMYLGSDPALGDAYVKTGFIPKWRFTPKPRWDGQSRACSDGASLGARPAMDRYTFAARRYWSSLKMI